jgi:hypothetical protein
MSLTSTCEFRRKSGRVTKIGKSRGGSRIVSFVYEDTSRSYACHAGSHRWTLVQFQSSVGHLHQWYEKYETVCAR